MAPYKTTTSNIDLKSDSDQNDQLLRKIEEITAGLAYSWYKNLRSIPVKSASIITDYIEVMKSETNPSDSYRRDIIEVLIGFSKYHDNKSFKDMTRDDILSYLDSFRKPEATDPLHKWIGTYNLYRIHLQRFFKWLYSPDIEHTGWYP